MTEDRDLELPLLMSPAEACRQLGIGLSKFNQLVARGELNVVRLGGARRVRSDELRRFVDRLEAPANTQRSSA